MKKVNISGFSSCGAFRKAKEALTGISAIFPSKYAVSVKEFPTRDEYMEWLETFRTSGSIISGAAGVGGGGALLSAHKTSPIVWFEDGKYLGGRDDTLAWLRRTLSDTTAVADDDSENPATATAAGGAASELENVDVFDKNHEYDYDLVVIGGGSGGLACSKEAQKLGAKVAVLDFVKPSPLGSKWGLGGTCVNVGCIPKKLMHNAALLGEHAKDAKAFGWSGQETMEHNWETMREAVQDHIKGLNFGYRVQLRESGITYLNKKGKFVDAHTLECTDAKGRTQRITGARFVIAVGGRPRALACPEGGGELALSSDDIFMKETKPGKTCVVGAGYVALECAGFLTGLHQGEVVVLVRSMLLRGFDRDAVNYIEDYMQHQGTRIVKGALPRSIERLPSGRLLVRYSTTTPAGEGEVEEEFDTVLSAVGRDPDLSQLGLEVFSSAEAAGPTAEGGGGGGRGGVEVHAKSGKIVCRNEQTSVPHVYAIGDVVHGAPELTPVAILTGKLLARRLFSPTAATTRGTGGGYKYMDYRNIATTVFTPIELGTVGMSEDEAIAALGADKVECYVSAFKPLEWSIVEDKEPLNGYAKIVVSKETEAEGGEPAGGGAGQQQRVLGMHIVTPNAGEIIQGFAAALRKGITYQDLMDTVGIHPTVAEEFTVMDITKSSGKEIAKSGC